MTEILLKFRDSSGRIWIGAAVLDDLWLEGDLTRTFRVEDHPDMDLKLTSVQVVVR